MLQSLNQHPVHEAFRCITSSSALLAMDPLHINQNEDMESFISSPDDYGYGQPRIKRKRLEDAATKVHHSQHEEATHTHPLTVTDFDEQEPCPSSPPHRKHLTVVVHHVKCDEAGYHSSHVGEANYLDPPHLFKGDSRASTLRGLQLMRDEINGFLATNEQLSMVVQRFYSCPQFYEALESTDTFVSLKQPDHPPLPEEIRPYFFRLSKTTNKAAHEREMLHLSQELIDALDQLSRLEFTLKDWRQHLEAPYTKLFMKRALIRSLADKHLDAEGCERVYAMMDHIERVTDAIYREAEALFSHGFVNEAHLRALFHEGEVIIKDIGTEDPLAYVVTRIPASNDPTCSLECYRILFDGRFHKKHETMVIEWPRDAKGQPTRGSVPIRSLGLYPLRYETTGTLRNALKSRGETVWGCRQRCLLDYQVPKTSFEIQRNNARYMVDYDMYRELEHDRHEQVTQRLFEDGVGDNGNDMEHIDVSQEPYIFLLPPDIKAFGLHDKRWRTVIVKYLRPVQWQKRAFNQLHLEPNKKDLIEAMVRMQISSNITSDVIEGKGKGLIILLHGGPGTGKTLTAESVAELAERPLYRVTCGDIGTSPDSVESYLESVLYIGSAWKAVVLLDESDVFLEEREKSDLQRNALVSVFLRVLEYYDGILILTSNRVGTFDEAFKSRVQLALHYPALDETGRREIWNNFFQLLRRQSNGKDPHDDRIIQMNDGERINIEDLVGRMDILAKHNLNGREIRNVITSARQLARFREKPMDSTHLNQAIGVVNEFQEYVEKTHGHTEEAYAQYMGSRAA